MRAAITIEQANVDDAGIILDLQKKVFLSEAALHGEFSIPPLHQTIESMYEDFSNYLILKAVSDNQIIGSVRAYQEDDTCYIGKLMVRVNHENMGIGKKLMFEIEKRFEKTASRFELFTGNQSLKNLNFYRKMGYEPFKAKSFSEKLILIFMEKMNDCILYQTNMEKAYEFES
jgi:ribosomal protein S18 acetylase RimI-like enzyme